MNSDASERLSSAKSAAASRRDVARRTRAAKAHAKALNRNRFNMSNEELNSQINRLQKQKQLRELTESEVTPRRKAAKDIASSVAKAVGTAALSAAIVIAIDNTLGESRSSVAREFGDLVGVGVKNRGSINGKKKD